MPLLNDGWRVFGSKPIIGMIHLNGTDRVRQALNELDIYAEEGIDGVIVENHASGTTVEDVRQVLHAAKPYVEKKRMVFGVNVLPNEFQLAFPIAQEYGAKFVQLDYVSGNYIEAPEGLRSHEFGAVRKRYPDIFVLGGVHPKYYTPFDASDLKHDLADAVQRAEAVVVTGDKTGDAPSIDKVKTFRRYVGDHRLVIGSGLTPQNAVELLQYADGAIVGSSLKVTGYSGMPVERKRVRELMKVVKSSIRAFS